MNKEVRRYLDMVSKERKQIVQKLHGLVMALYPSAKVDMSYRMPTYKSSDGWIAIANQKRYVSLYTCGAHHLVEFKKNYPGIRTGKGCLNFKATDKIPVTAVKKVIKHAMEQDKLP